MTSAQHKIPITILLGDDDEDDRRCTQEVLEHARVVNSVRWVADGEALLDYLRQRGAFAGETGKAPRPSLILLDANMPKMRGREVLALIRSDPELLDIPIVVLSRSRQDEDVVRGYALGVSSFIIKPVTASALVEALTGLGRYWLQIVELAPTHGQLGYVRRPA